jgi:hypothetical protein
MPVVLCLPRLDHRNTIHFSAALLPSMRWLHEQATGRGVDVVPQHRGEIDVTDISTISRLCQQFRATGVSNCGALGYDKQQPVPLG